MAWEDFYGETVLVAIVPDVRHPFDDGANGCALTLGDQTLFVFENPNDGYRSSAAEPLVSKQDLYSFGTHPEYLRIPVLVRALTPTEYADGADGIELVDRRNGKAILRLGTNNVDDYYPTFVCEWSPQNLAENVAA